MSRKRKIPKTRKGRTTTIIFCIAGLLFFIAAAGTGLGGLAVYNHYSRGLPDISFLKKYRPAAITTVYSDDNQKIAEFYKERRIVVPYSEIPDMLIKAFVASEDARFFEHEGIDLKSIIRAALKNFEAGRVVQGGSTITQQVIKCFLLTPERKYERKIKEAILAFRIDKAFSKQDILYLYLNEIYLGHGAYGVAAAAENYFGKTLKELTLAESAILAGLPQAPSDYSPFRHFEEAKKRQQYVLNRMAELEFITRDQAEKAFNEELEIKPRRNWYIEHVPYYTEHVRRYVEAKYGQELLYKGGLKIYTAVNVDMQKAARKAVDKGLRELDKRHFGYRGPINNLKPDEIEPFLKNLEKEQEDQALIQGDIVNAVVDNIDSKEREIRVFLGKDQGIISFNTMKWAGHKADRKAKTNNLAQALVPGDLIWVRLEQKNKDTGYWDLTLEQTPKTQSALICLESGTGHVKAMIGGRDFKSSQFNRAVQAKRQPGSAFKPIIYAAALDKGYTPATEIIDNVFIYQNAKMKWMPKNYDRKFYGPTLLRKALAKSRNLSTIQILNDIGVDYAVEYAKKLGIESELSPNLSLALGSSGVSLLELSTAYSVFNNKGFLIQPVFITKILDRDGNELEKAEITKKKVIEQSTAYLMTSLMESVVKEGTATKVRAINRPAAGKTGTTNNLHDAWFMGYTPDYIAGTWVGYDQEQSLGSKESGGRAAIPIWLDFMKEIHKDKPVKGFKAPKNVVFSKIDADTGLLPVPDTKKVIFECFKKGTVPTRYSRRSDSISEKDQFYKMEM
ncbi:Penicillin-binding protein 1A [Desulfonema limicola]|uniref:Penicillin-binding protein 1A n=1 Tax=Desulfonema limicola TaxID=45656 RepID=A0A975B3I4_9BACT|nr:PBP1A family penicillin-binding protein [Desulfonema limicola]QTA78124.1 Penicillin-binding protein 1A [Desulfonema limicola]